MKNQTNILRTLSNRAIRGVTALALLAGLVIVGPALVAAPAQAAPDLTPMSHTIDYIVVSKTTNTDFMSKTDLEALTTKTSDVWSRESRGVIKDIKMGLVFRVPNYTGDFCRLYSGDPFLEATLGYSMEAYGGNDGRHLVVVGSNLEFSCNWRGLTVWGGTSWSSGGMIDVLARSNYGDIEKNDTNLQYDASTIVHELGHVFGLWHASVANYDCDPRYWDGPFFPGTGLGYTGADGCPLVEYGDRPNAMSNSERGSDMSINGVQKYELGLIQPGSGLLDVTAGVTEQVVEITDRHTSDLTLLQSVRVTADDPDGPGPCGSPVYQVDYDPVNGGVQVFRVVTSSDCGTSSIGSTTTISVRTPEGSLYFQPGQAFVTQSGNVRISFVSVDTDKRTAKVSIRRVGDPGFTTLQLASYRLRGNEMSAAAAGNQAAVVVTTSAQRWSASSDQSWVSVTSSGTNADDLVLAISPNPTDAQRTAVVTVTAGSERSTFSVVQQAGPSRDDCYDDHISGCLWRDLASPLQGSIETPGDRDEFRFKPTVAGTWSFVISGPGAAGLTNPAGLLRGNVCGQFGQITQNGSGLGTGEYRVSAQLTAGEVYAMWVWGANDSTGTYMVVATAPEARISLSEDTWSASDAGGGTTLSVTSNTPWTLGVLPDWLHVDHKAGAPGSVDTTLVADPNTGSQNRTWSVEFTGQGQTARLAVSQPMGAIASLSVTPGTWAAPSAGDDLKVTVTTNGAWQLKLPDWVRASLTSGSGTLEVTLTALPNTTGAARSGQAEFTAGGSKAVVSVTQDPQPSATISVWPQSWSVPGSGDSGAVRVTSNSDWRVTLPDWVTADRTSGTGDDAILLRVTANTTGQSRSGKVVVSTAGKQAEMLVTQAAQVVQPSGDQCGVSTTTACEWPNLDTPLTGQVDDMRDRDWYRIVPATSGSWTLVSSVPASGGIVNPYAILYDANGTVVAHDNDGVPHFSIKYDMVAGSTYYLEVKDYAYESTGSYTVTAIPPNTPPVPTISVSPGSWTAPYTGDSLPVRVTANAAWQLSLPSWVVASTVFGTGDATVTLTALANSTGQSRTGSATFSVSGKQVVMSVSQDAQPVQHEPPVIWVSPTSWPAPDSGARQVIQVTSNSDWQLSLPGWVTADRASGSGNAVVTLRVDANTTGADRSGSAVFSVTGQQATVSVTQPTQPVNPGGNCGSTRDTACTWSNLTTLVSGVFETVPDGDWYKITPTTGGTWTLTSSIPATGGCPDPVGLLYDSNGTLVAQDDDRAGNRQFSINVTLQAGNTYYLLVVPLPNGSQVNRGAYIVTATVQ